MPLSRPVAQAASRPVCRVVITFVVSVAVRVIYLMRRNRAVFATIFAMALVSIVSACGSTAKPEQPVTAATSKPASVVIKNTCSLPGLQVFPSTVFGGSSYFETVPLSNISGRPITIGGFPKVTVYSTAAGSAMPNRERISVTHRGPDRKPITMAGDGRKFIAGAQLDLRLGGPVAKGTHVRNVQVIGVQVAFGTERCTLGSGSPAPQVVVPVNQPMPITTTSLAHVKP
jgi:hypothetical protein